MTETEHLLICLMEEASEVAQACAKALRFGLDDEQPRMIAPSTARLSIQTELNDVLAVCQLLSEASVLPMIWIEQKMLTAKREKLKRMMDYARRKGTLEDK
jgi:NTP pyrophosphatase (non-canonical NTP hydrolase)